MMVFLDVQDLQLAILALGAGTSAPGAAAEQQSTPPAALADPQGAGAQGQAGYPAARASRVGARGSHAGEAARAPREVRAGRVAG